MIDYFEMTDSGMTKQVDTETKANWLHIQQPTSEDITYLRKSYQIPADYLSAILNNHEISRHEGLQQTDFSSPVLLLLQHPRLTTSTNGFKEIETVPFSIILTPTKLITCSNYPLPLNISCTLPNLFVTPPLQPVVAKSIELASYFSTLFNFYLKSINTETTDLERELQHSTENTQLFQLMGLQKSLIYFDSALSQNLAVLEQARLSPLISAQADAQKALGALTIETKQAITSGKIQTELLSQLNNLFSAIVSNNMNMVIKVLTVITVVLTIPTVVGGIYGMNVRLPFAESEHAFWWLSLLTFIFSVITLWVLKRKKYF